MTKEKAYAKVNLYLNVIDKRIDGFHDLEMVMASVDLFDILTFEELDSQEILVESSTHITDRMEDNLVYQIATYLKREFDILKGVKITIEKHIPIAAGLAGGSADAAATIRGLNRIWKLRLSLEDMATIGSSFGSDIPFCVYNKLCVARGRGEDLCFIDKKLKLPILLINPNIKVSTKEVFGKVKKKELIQRKITDMTAGIYNKNVSLITRELFNSLEPMAFELEPKIRDIKNLLKDSGIDGVLMSGSGATVFAISKNKKKLQDAQDLFNDYYYKKLTKLR